MLFLRNEMLLDEGVRGLLLKCSGFVNLELNWIREDRGNETFCYWLNILASKQTMLEFWRCGRIKNGKHI